jgi:zinc D-Ala-D-Ala carboxypeptidase
MAIKTKKISDHFFEYEFACKCHRQECDAKPMKPSFMQKLERLRVEWGKPLVPASGTRCKYWNEDDSVRGAPKSQHLQGNAADFNFYSSTEKNLFVILAEKFGFRGIGVGKYLVHIDDRKNVARWTYAGK